MLASALRMVPLRCYDPLRHAVTRFRRGSLPRGASVAVLKHVAKAHRHLLCSKVREIRPLDVPDISFEPVDSMVMDAVYWFGVQGYEGMVPDVWVSRCRTARSILEIGGNVGIFTIIGARATRGAYTVVEPVPAIAQVLRNNVRRNGLDQVQIIEAAAIPGEERADVQLNIPDERRSAPVGAFLAIGSEVHDRAAAQSLSVTGIPFSELARGRDLIKIDAEGIEAELLSSARDLLIAQRTDLLVEVLPDSTRLAGVLRALAEQGGYRIVVIPEWGSDKLITVAVNDFGADLPRKYNSKDVLLTLTAD